MTRVTALAAALALAACYDPPVGSPQTKVIESPAVTVSPKNKVDLLFMIDNSNSMDAMQTQLRARFQTFFDAFANAAAQHKYADLHIGVVTSDFGASGAPKGIGCDDYGGGQAGKLQALGAKAPAGCVAPVGQPFIQYNFDPAAQARDNLPASQSLVQTFTCMASVGSSGCGYEHQLESVYAALHNNIPENKDFLRPDARLAIVFLTNEDDGSAPPDSRIYDTTNIALGPVATSYRQTMWGVECGVPPALTPNGSSMGALHGCTAAPNSPSGAGLGHEFDIARYIDLFTQPKLAGGIKYNPDDVILVGIDALYDDQQGLQVMLASGVDNVTHQYTPCSVPSEQPPRCEPALLHACQNQADPAFFGDAAVRLNQVITKAKVNKLLSICDNDYTPAMQAIADLLTEPPAGCIPDVLPDPMDPDCVVEDWTTPQGQQVPAITEIPRCDRAPAGATCWRVEAKDACTRTSPQGVGVTVDRHGMDQPPDTFVNAHCNGVPPGGPDL